MPNDKRVPILYRLLRRVPTRARLLLVYLGSPKMTVGTSAVIWDREGRVLMVRHTYRYPAWGLPSGLIHYREEPSAALERELYEELDVQATADAILHLETHALVRHITVYYHVTLRGIPCHNGSEIDAHRYVALEDWEGLVGAPPKAWLFDARGRRQRATIQ